jgi:hypothetical protein
MFNNAKKYLNSATLALPGTYRMALFTSACNLKTGTSAKPLLAYGSVTSQVANGSGYVTSGQTLTNERWTASANASTFLWRYTTTPPTGNGKWSANGGSITGIKFAAIFLSHATAGSRLLLCYVTLTTGAGGITLADTNTLTIKPAATGIFTLGGM